mmetsp:Transcript_81337/g.263875  ORF Transcript_81337/g.263875 Transcript_81337/m.263875 type:complete len:598 (+) Transcript_81337:4129-5922(+)
MHRPRLGDLGGAPRASARLPRAGLGALRGAEGLGCIGQRLARDLRRGPHRPAPGGRPRPPPRLRAALPGAAGRGRRGRSGSGGAAAAAVGVHRGLALVHIHRAVQPPHREFPGVPQALPRLRGAAALGIRALRGLAPLAAPRGAARAPEDGPGRGGLGVAHLGRASRGPRILRLAGGPAPGAGRGAQGRGPGDALPARGAGGAAMAGCHEPALVTRDSVLLGAAVRDRDDEPPGRALACALARRIGRRLWALGVGPPHARPLPGLGLRHVLRPRPQGPTGGEAHPRRGPRERSGGDPRLLLRPLARAPGAGLRTGGAGGERGARALRAEPAAHAAGPRALGEPGSAAPRDRHPGGALGGAAVVGDRAAARAAHGTAGRPRRLADVPGRVGSAQRLGPGEPGADRGPAHPSGADAHHGEDGRQSGRGERGRHCSRGVVCVAGVLADGSRSQGRDVHRGSSGPARLALGRSVARLGPGAGPGGTPGSGACLALRGHAHSAARSRRHVPGRDMPLGARRPPRAPSRAHRSRPALRALRAALRARPQDRVFLGVAQRDRPLLSGTRDERTQCHRAPSSRDGREFGPKGLACCSPREDHPNC